MQQQNTDSSRLFFHYGYNNIEWISRHQHERGMLYKATCLEVHLLSMKQEQRVYLYTASA